MMVFAVGCRALTYPSLEGSPRWANSSAGWPVDGPLDDLGLMTFPLGSAPWVQTPTSGSEEDQESS
jgi:hypothetical protein